MSDLAEDKVRVILRELRQKNVHLEQELTELERTLSVRTKRKLGTKVSRNNFRICLMARLGVHQKKSCMDTSLLSLSTRFIKKYKVA